MRFVSMFSLCLAITACGGDSSENQQDDSVTGDETSPDDGVPGDGDGDGDDASTDDDTTMVGSDDDKPTDDHDDMASDDAGVDDDEPTDDGPGVEDVWSCHSVFTVGGNGETSTSCTEYRGENAKAFAEPGCMDIGDTAQRTLSNAACSLEGAILRCDYAAQNSANVFYTDSSSQLDSLKMTCEQQGAVATVL